jgi:hypothetical protein
MGSPKFVKYLVYFRFFMYKMSVSNAHDVFVEAGYAINNCAFIKCSVSVSELLLQMPTDNSNLRRLKKIGDIKIPESAQSSHTHHWRQGMCKRICSRLKLQPKMHRRQRVQVAWTWISRMEPQHIRRVSWVKCSRVWRRSDKVR